MASTSKALLAALLIAGTAPVFADPAALAPEALLASFPEAWEGFSRDAPAYEEAIFPGELGTASARYSPPPGGNRPSEYVLRLKDLGVNGGRMYQDYGADYLKGPVENDTQHSLEIQGQPALLTSLGEGTMEITTFFAPRLILSAFCMNTDAASCQATLERMDFTALKALSAGAE